MSLHFEDHSEIYVQDLELECFIGVYDHEKQAPQRIIINASVQVAANETNLEDDIQNVMSYEDIVTWAEQLTQDKHIHLVETFADRLATKCLSHPLAQAVTIQVEKPDIFPASTKVGTRLTRRKISS